MEHVPGERDRGVFYWAPEWIAVAGVPSAWENATLFDFGGMVLPSMDALTGQE
jgi:arabinogalactan endo-1,4-beta-galactosidase